MRDKLYSGRFILTVVSAGVFAWTAIAKTLPSEAVAAILSLVFVSYFQKKENQ